MLVVVHYHEIALKGKNRSYFENKLIENIKAKISTRSVRKDMTRIVVETDDGKDKVKHFLSKTPGIAKFAFAKKVEKTPESIFREFENWLNTGPQTPISIEVKRADKSFPLNSLEITQKLMQIARQKGFQTSFKNSASRFYVEIAKDIYVFDSENVFEGVGGVPVGTSGKALSLFSGGIDSPVASFLAIKRGLYLDFIHFHAFPTGKAVLETKIPQIIRVLADSLPRPPKLYLVPYHRFQIAFAGAGKYELVLFKLFMRRVAEKVAQDKGYDLLVSGDNLAQVASQTVSSLKVIWEGAKVLAIHPLIGFDKQEIVNLAKKIGTFELSTQEYKDCCSIVARHPETKPKPAVVARISGTKLDDVVEKTLNEIEVFEIS